MLRAAVTVKPAKGPAPTLVTRVSPAYTCMAPTKPPMTAHQGMDVGSLVVGKGCGMMKKAPVKKKVITANDTAEASYGFVKYLFR